MSRLVLLLIFLLGLTLFALSNLSPVVLMFLGAKSLPLPLGVWVMAALATGFFFSLLLSLLFQLSNYLSEQQLQVAQRTLRSAESRIRTLEAESSRYRWQSPQSSSDGESRSYSTTQTSAEYDYLEKEDDEEGPIDDTQEGRDNVRNRTTYETEQAPTSSSKTGSVYSYSYKEPKNSGVGKTESVYDAEYRVITPPYRGEPKKSENDWEYNKSGNDEDWGFEDDDEFDDEDDRSPLRS
ncbi:lipopolysaccharide assembly protein LapA domain-containing protein [Argonema antarcticum]|uniref:lipopolysaccharide assembly protein LapA domain-containing protein n=1 Tax=Argonema antarcticum TaxID=2942763 RepID=UPI002011060D|nr:lipopolysaccharide assembly protein LapA domain-containing protein [Argonema antarcticum]MCL1470475.1 lipopolysaccharide assembly protein LapA domain-containing protein [Argonema antarcticum A004/B2]